MTVSALVEPAYRSIPPYTRTLGGEVAELAELAGFAPDPEQRMALDDLFALKPDNRVAAFEFAVVCSRQNLKTALFKQAALGWLYITDQRLVVWSAHEFRTAQEAFREMAELIEGSPYLRRRLKPNGIHRSTGNEAIELSTGQRLIFKARTKGGGRGLSGDKVVLDEAYALNPGHMGALLPTLSARPDPQVVYGSSAGQAESDVLRSIRDRGRAGGDPSLAYVEWCDDLPGACLQPGCTHALDTEGCILDDVARWARANPAMGRRITVDYIAAERRALPPSEFGRERLGWWDEATAAAIINYLAWLALEDATSKAVTVTAFGVEIALDRNSAAVGVAGPRDDDLVHLEVVERQSGVDWLLTRCTQLNDSWHPSAFVIDTGGPAAPLIAEFEAAGLPVLPTTTEDVAAATAWMVDSVAQGTQRHIPNFELDAAVAGARKRMFRDGGFAFGRSASEVPIETLQAVNLAAWGHSQLGAVGASAWTI